MAVYEEVDVLFVANYHDVDAQGDLEQQIIEVVEPDYVGVEDCPADHQVSEQVEQIHEYKTIYDAAKSVYAEGDELFDSNPEQCLQEAKQIIDGEVSPDEPRNYDEVVDAGVIPETVNEFVSTPVYELHPRILRTVKDDIQKNAESHNADTASESLETVADVYGAIHKYVYRKSASWPRLADSLEVKLETGEIEDVISSVRPESVQSPLYTMNPSKLHAFGLHTDKDAAEIKAIKEDITEEREQRMADEFATYTEDTEKPIVTTMGPIHLLGQTPLKDKLEAQDISYCTVWLDPEEPFRQSAEEYLDEAVSEGEPTPSEVQDALSEYGLEV